MIISTAGPFGELTCHHLNLVTDSIAFVYIRIEMNSYKWLVVGVITKKAEETSKLNNYNNLFRIGIAG